MLDQQQNVRVIKKYQNRKLYDTKDSCYITLDEIATLIRKGEDVTVVDNRTKADVTSIILTQILVDQEKANKSILPLTMLKNIIQRGQGSLFDFIQRYVLLGVDSEGERQVEAERYIDRLVTRGELTKAEGKTLLKEVLETSEKNRTDFDQYVGTQVAATLKETTPLSDLERSVVALTQKVETLQRKLAEYEQK